MRWILYLNTATHAKKSTKLQTESDPAVYANNLRVYLCIKTGELEEFFFDFNLPLFFTSGESVFLSLICFHRWETWTVGTFISSVCLLPMWLVWGSRLRPAKISCVRSGQCQSQVKTLSSHSECLMSYLILILLLNPQKMSTLL